MINKIETLTREQIKQKMMFDTKENIKMFKSICEEILNETCSWKLYTNCGGYKMAQCNEQSDFFRIINQFKFCPYCGKEIEEAVNEV